jgi:Polyketide cyclase / dehydrase and lipid transport
VSIRVEHEAVVDGEASAVYEFIAAPANLPEWQDGVMEVRGAPDGVAQVGDRWTEVRRGMGARVEAQVEVAEADPPRLFVVSSVAGPVTFRVVHELEELDGNTRVKVSGEGEQRGLFRFAGPVVARQAQQSFERALVLLKQRLE